MKRAQWDVSSNTARDTDDRMKAYVELYLPMPVRRYECLVPENPQYVAKNYVTTAEKGLSSRLEIERVDSNFW